MIILQLAMKAVVIAGVIVILVVVVFLIYSSTNKEGYNGNSIKSAQFTVARPKYNPGPNVPPGSRYPPPRNIPVNKSREKWAPFMTSNADPKAIVPIQNLRASWTGPTSNPFVGGWNGQLSGGLSSIKSTVMETTGAENSSESMMFKTVI